MSVDKADLRKARSVAGCLGQFGDAMHRMKEKERLAMGEEETSNDPWKHRSTGMTCQTCMWFCNFRCRRHAPTLGGYPAVFKADWCGDHKLDKKTMGGE